MRKMNMMKKTMAVIMTAAMTAAMPTVFVIVSQKSYADSLVIQCTTIYKTTVPHTATHAALLIVPPLPMAPHAFSKRA